MKKSVKSKGLIWDKSYKGSKGSRKEKRKVKKTSDRRHICKSKVYRGRWLEQKAYYFDLFN